MAEVSRYLLSVSETLRVHAPGRVNLIGEHTDYTGGLVFPMAINRGITLSYTAADGVVELTSDGVPGVLSISLPFDGAPNAVEPHWGSYIAAMAAELRATQGLRGHVLSDIPAGAGLSSSAALECAIGLALGFDGTPARTEPGSTTGRAPGNWRADGHHGSAFDRRRGCRARDAHRLPRPQRHPARSFRATSMWWFDSSHIAP